MKRKDMQELEQDLKELSAGKILDIATGRGEFINMLTHSIKEFDSIIGIDSSKKSLEVAKEHFKDEKIKFQKMDAYQLEFQDASFNTVCISNSLHHFSEVGKLLIEMKRVLRKGGNIIINEMHCDDTQTEEQKTHVLLHHWWGEIDTRLGIIHNRTFTSQQLLEIISVLDLSKKDIYEFTYPIKDPKDKKMIDTYLTYFDPYVERLKEHPDFKKLKEEGDELKTRLIDVGFAPATSLFILGKK